MRAFNSALHHRHVFSNFSFDCDDICVISEYDAKFLWHTVADKRFYMHSDGNRLLSKKKSMGKILITAKTLGNDMAIAYDSVGPTNLISNQSKCNT